ncbi:class F sortase [Terrabacter sp. Ter38]|uniref:class F sortase n=1 Tax=Terrabacter sp. Ter38 TaxID=2926030 RepID=UPI0021196A50|nr:class F sortase [Terrabacter sp. Ter38]
MSAVATDRPSPRARSTTAGPVTPARVARTAASERVRFRPERVSLPDGASAPVDPAATVGGVLAVPADIRRVGWWDGSAWVGDPFGSTVVAGHLDAPGQGLGFFEQLTGLRRGDVVTLTGSGHRAAYRVTEVAAMRKSSIDATSPVFDQRGEHRLVLMTCAGHFDRATHSYDENLVVTAVPDGAAH